MFKRHPIVTVLVALLVLYVIITAPAVAASAAQGLGKFVTSALNSMIEFGTGVF